ncbi:ParB/Srx family N-terminal domain-containing protein [Chitinophaga defluvii]|uniref:ParB/Srx family N-terminal domain-containing protein n=1 Tax=Chitinophaga defluvii TaxID=3163343 RepID=A0ABV2T8U8_9BACT
MKLKKATVSLVDLLLDPNNPRFADISDESLNIPNSRFTEDEVQKHAYEKMMNSKFDVLSLANSIETVGFLPVDNIVAKELDNSKYVVIEGNRRTTALKYIVKQFALGQNLLEQAQIDAISVIDILIVDNVEDDQESIGKIIQGIRNVAGIKEWDAYQKAQFISEMIDKGKDPGTISKMIGMSVRDINRYYKTYSAMAQFRADEEYGSKWKHSYFSHFDEVLRRPVLREYFGWDDEHYRFNNMAEYRRFYDWIIPDESGASAITDVHQIRTLVNFIDEPKALNYLDDKNFQKAINFFEQKNLNAQKTTLPECMSRILSAIDAFKNIIGEGLENEMTKEDVEEVENNIDEMKKQIKRIKKLKEGDA